MENPAGARLLSMSRCTVDVAERGHSTSQALVGKLHVLFD